MSESKWASKEYLEIHRRDDRAWVADSEGCPLFSVPLGWSDEDVWHCLSVANQAHLYGAQKGRSEIQSAMRRLLDIGGSIEFEIEAHERREHHDYGLR